MKKITVGILCFVMLFVLVACSSSPSEPAEPAEQSVPADTTTPDTGKIRIGYACANVNNTFQSYLVDAARDFAAANNIEFSVSDGQQDVVMQQDQVKAMIENALDAIVICPADTSAMEPVTNAAKEAGVPLVYVNSNPYSNVQMPEGIYYVGSDETVAGRLQMEKAGELLGGQGNICILIGDPGYEASRQRTDGVKEIIAEKYPDIKVLAEETGEWQREKAVSITENWLTAYDTDLNCVIANNDEMALGAIQALTAAGRDDVIVIGIDAIPDAVKAIEAGSMNASVFQDAVGQAGGAMQIALDLVNGKAPSDPILWIPFILVDNTNYSEYK